MNPARRESGRTSAAMCVFKYLILKHRGEEQRPPGGQQEVEGEQRAEEESVAGLQEIPGILIDLNF